MEMQPICIPCLLNRTLYETNLVDPSKGFETIMVGLSILEKEFRPGRNSAEVATYVHKAVYDILGVDPYKEIKERSNKVALELLPVAEEYINSSDDKILASVHCAIAGNVIDFGIRSQLTSPEDLKSSFGGLVREGLEVDHIGEMKEMLASAKSVLYFTDNCGEIVFDKLVLRELKKAYGAQITVIVRGEPILTDATIEDAEELGIAEYADEVTTTNSFAVGVNFEKIEGKLKAGLGNCDLIISKGMANYESFSDTGYRPIIYLMRTKCKPIADSIGAPLDKNVAKLYK